MRYRRAASSPLAASPSPGLTKTCKVWPWQLRCQRKLKYPGPTTPGKLPVVVPCAERAGTEAIVECVIYREGQGGNWYTWRCIGSRESGWNAGATGRAGERGVFQVHPIHIAWLGWERWSHMYEPEPNTMAAIELYVRAGYSFSPWASTIRSCY